ncbi:MAG TPA: magnesium chelatase [Verrucomicrobiales bacterium]|nr:magnesium chelatase [Verrucomicrobiales bacterium]
MADQEIACPNCGDLTRLTKDDGPIIRIPKKQTREHTPAAESSTAVQALGQRILDNVEKVIVGKAPSIQLALVAWLSEGHVLLEDVPGTAKTMLARALARSVGCTFKRIQCTPDLLPGEITGVSVFNPQTTQFEFRPGPVFAQIVLADEVNRATPRAQSAFLEAMAERRVSVDGVDHPLEPPFFVIATQNPIDHEGTFPLPEAQLDRFLVRMTLGYPGLKDEDAMLERIQKQHPIDELGPVATAAELLAAQAAVKETMVHPLVRDYIVRLVHATREHASVRLGASPRASAAIMRASQAYAALQGFDYVLPDDIKEVAPHILGHRLIIQPESRLRKITAGEVIREILHRVEVPVLPEKRI